MCHSCLINLFRVLYAGFGVIFQSDGMQWRVWQDSTSYGFYNTANAITPADLDVADGEWAHIAWVWDVSGIDGTTDTQRVYLNGVDIASTTNTMAIPTDLPDAFTIGTNTYTRSEANKTESLSTGALSPCRSSPHLFEFLFSCIPSAFDQPPLKGLRKVTSRNCRPDFGIA